MSTMSLQQSLGTLTEIIHNYIDAGRMARKSWYYLGRQVVKSYASLLFVPDIVYHTPLPAGPKILVVNHPCTVDPFMITLVVPDQVCILILDTLFNIPVVGASLRFCEHIRVDSENGAPAMAKALQYAKEGRTLGVFPEGSISPIEGGYQRPHSGAARLALASGASVIPVGIHLDPRYIRLAHTRVKGKSELGTWYTHGPYAMTVGKPVVFQGDAEDRELVSKTTVRIMDMITEVDQESAQRIYYQQMHPSPRTIEPSLLIRLIALRMVKTLSGLVFAGSK
jgi:1-acyl-sn-glycerol-3-phosphate acyltransferase